MTTTTFTIASVDYELGCAYHKCSEKHAGCPLARENAVIDAVPLVTDSFLGATKPEVS